MVAVRSNPAQTFRAIPVTDDNQAARVEVDEQRIGDLELRITDMKGHSDRLTHIEDVVNQHTSQLAELQWWGRWIGVALLSAAIKEIMLAVKRAQRPAEHSRRHDDSV